MRVSRIDHSLSAWQRFGVPAPRRAAKKKARFDEEAGFRGKGLMEFEQHYETRMGYGFAQCGFRVFPIVYPRFCFVVPPILGV